MRMVNAMGFIDDELILEAMAPSKAKNVTRGFVAVWI